MRIIQWRQFEEILRPYLMEHDWRDLLTRAQELRIPFGPVMGPRLLLEDEHLKERAFFQEVEQPGVGQVLVAGAPFWMSETPLRVGPAPALGGDTQEVLAELGYDAEDARVLRERGVT
jgi:crotonobetainyl-CoA:carnitine CoA-transferase CaiB-like acyl-CoA transferase